MIGLRQTTRREIQKKVKKSKRYTSVTTKKKNRVRKMYKK